MHPEFPRQASSPQSQGLQSCGWRRLGSSLQAPAWPLPPHPHTSSRHVSPDGQAWSHSLHVLPLPDPETLPSSRWTHRPPPTGAWDRDSKSPGLFLPFERRGEGSSTPTEPPEGVTYGPSVRSQSPFLPRQACLVICEPFHGWRWPGSQGDGPYSIPADPAEEDR